VVAKVKAAVGSLATVYCTEDDVKAGVNVHEKIQDQIDKSAMVIGLYTANGADSIYLHEEIGYAKKAKKLILPVVASGVADQKLGMLQGIEQIRIDETAEDWMTRLTLRVRELVRADAKNNATLDLMFGVALIAVVVFAMSQS
jgi:hypothetical protein